VVKFKINNTGEYIPVGLWLPEETIK
jgi:hypothetical protein